jgi:hypothetical protein
LGGATPPLASIAAFSAALRSSLALIAAASRSRRWSGVRPSSLPLPPPLAAARLAARSRSVSRWFPRACGRRGGAGGGGERERAAWARRAARGAVRLGDWRAVAVARPDRRAAAGEGTQEDEIGGGDARRRHHAPLRSWACAEV